MAEAVYEGKRDKEDEECELLLHLDQLHITVLGAERVKRNLGLDVSDAVAWCREKIAAPDSGIVRRGKNWYIQTAGCEITVNAYSYTIITAHPIKG